MDLDELRELVETDLANGALTTLMNAAIEVVDSRLGPAGPLVETRYPAGPLFGLSRQAIEIISVVEHGETLASSAYSLRRSGMIVERLSGRRWHGRVDVEYQPLPDEARRAKAIAALVELDIEHHPGVASFRFGSFAESFVTQGDASYREKVEEILSALEADVEGILR